MEHLNYSDDIVTTERVLIGRNFLNQPLWKKLLGVPLIYLPIITTIPFVLVGVFLVTTHLKYVGGMNIRPYRDFIPSLISHRYRWDNQITYSTDVSWYSLRSYRFFWIFNCKIYCPLSVGLFKYASYLVKIVENWWCPFDHDKKQSYADGAIDQSYWHLTPKDLQKLHPADRNNPVWNYKIQEDINIELLQKTKSEGINEKTGR